MSSPMPPRLSPETEREWRGMLAPWCARWGVPRLEARLEIELSPRFRTTLARCSPARRVIRVAAFLVEAPRPLLEEVLCHEAAHAAVAELHGRRLRPHGREWRELMRAAGFEPRVRLPPGDLEALPERAIPGRVTWEHRCPVCQRRRSAGRPVRQWRCVACWQAGLDGRLLITRVGARAGSRASSSPATRSSCW
jgi:predicted SprT family Zn-dependent metalloprotease